MAKEKVKVVLDDGSTEVETTKTGWENVTDIPVLLAGWQEGKASHHPISLGLALAAKEAIPEAYLGDYQGVPVIDPKILNAKMAEAFCEAYDIEPAVVRVATNRGAKKQLESMKAELAGNEEVMAILQAQNPELASKLQNL